MKYWSFFNDVLCPQDTVPIISPKWDKLQIYLEGGFKANWANSRSSIHWLVKFIMSIYSGITLLASPKRLDGIRSDWLNEHQLSTLTTTVNNIWRLRYTCVLWCQSCSRHRGTRRTFSHISDWMNLNPQPEGNSGYE